MVEPDKLSHNELETNDVLRRNNKRHVLQECCVVII